jgi:hypothetical protein
MKPSKLASTTVAAAALLSILALAPDEAAAGDSVNILILKEHGVGSAASAQEYVDKLVATVAQQNGWAAGAGKYHTTRSSAKGWIKEADPHYGIMSLGAFLDLRGAHKLEVIGSAEVLGGGGLQYSIVSTSAASLADCKGKTLGTDHGDDVRFIDKVVSGSDFDLADFQVVDTKRPVKTIKSAIAGEVGCALIDDAQLASVAKTEGGDKLVTVWQSKKLPPMVVVAFPSAPAAERKGFTSNLDKVCTGDGAAACKEVGLVKLAKADGTVYDAAIKAYDAP